jgi:hypothetical protein
VHGTEIDGIISAVKGNLQLQVVFFVDIGVSNLTDQLSDVLSGVRLGISFSLHVGLVLDVIRKHL